MYELICPACKHAIELPFVRLGAQAVCRSCAHRFTVQKETVRNLVAEKVATDTGNDQDNPLLLGQGVSKPPPPARSVSQDRPSSAAPPEGRSNRAIAEDSPPSATAVSGAAAAASQPDPDLKPIQPVLAHQEPSPDVARLIARHRARRQRRQRIIIAFVAIILLLAGLAGYLLFHNPPNQQATGSGERPDDGKSQVLANFDGPVLRSTLLPTASWEETDENAPQVQLLDRGPIRVMGAKLEAGADGRTMFRATLDVDGYQVIEEADLVVMLVDERERMFARYRMAMALLIPGQSPEDRRSVTLAVPRALAPQTKRVMAYVTAKLTMVGGVPFDKVLLEPVGSGTHAAVKITAFNPTAAPMERALFHIRAFNSAGEAVGRWTVQWKTRIDPRQRVEFAAITALKSDWTITAWEVVGAGATDKDVSGAKEQKP